jgi:hypothetical protein
MEELLVNGIKRIFGTSYVFLDWASLKMKSGFIRKPSHVQDVGVLYIKYLKQLAIRHSFLHVRRLEFLDNTDTIQGNSLSLTCRIRRAVPIQ